MAGLLENDQLWETDKYVLKVERVNPPDSVSTIPTVRAVVFARTVKGLRFLEFIWHDEVYVERLIKTMKMERSDKKLTLE